MSLNVEHLRRMADTLEQAILRLGEVAVEDVLYDLYRNAAMRLKVLNCRWKPAENCCAKH